MNTREHERGIFLLLGLTILTVSLVSLYKSIRNRLTTASCDRSRWLPPIAVLIGGEVGFSSAGAGALGAIALLNLTKLKPPDVVGTDMVFGLVISILGGGLHYSAGHYDSPILTGLIIGGLFGVLSGATLSSVLPHRPLRLVLSVWVMSLGAQLCWKSLVGGVTMASRLGLVFASVWFAAGALAAPLSVQLRATLPSPQPVGTPIGLVPRTENAAKGMLVFRYAVSAAGGPFTVVRDFSQQREFTWLPELVEHRAMVRVTVRNNGTKETAEADLPFQVVSRLKRGLPVLTPTSHPLIALFSAPPCTPDTQFRVAFGREGDEALARTPPEPCRGTASNNVYVAGMQADTDYRLRAEWVRGGVVETGSWMPFHTGVLDGDFPVMSVAVPRAAGVAGSEPVLIHSMASISAGKRPLATDLEGRIIWYLRSPDLLYRVLPRGRFLVQGEGQNSVNDTRRGQVLREVDLAGNTIRETNAGRVAEQLESRGIRSDCRKGGKECVSGFHHDAIRLPNGHTLAIAALERMMPAGTQGSKEPVDVVGDIVVDLDEQFQVSGVWNSLDHLDLNRPSLQNAKCKEGPGRAGCPPIFLAAEANGWTHSNSLNYVPATGDFLISVPEQDWVVKVDWRDGKGSGRVLWRLGKDGDFAPKADDPDPWFSFQHDAGFEPAGGSNLLSVFDNGHVRFRKNPKANNRGQVWRLDEEARTATLLYNADLEVYSAAVGSAQTLRSGGYSFEAGLLDRDSPHGRAVETDQQGRIVFALEVDGAVVYRSFRVDDVYSPPAK